METIKIYIDGSCYGNGGGFNKFKPTHTFGGWAMICVKNNETFYQESGGELFTTNNKMEMMAMEKALEYIIRQEMDNDVQYQIYSDSEYVVLSSLFYTKKWVKNEWMRVTDQGKIPIKNKDRWVKIYELLHQRIPNMNKKVTIHKIKAHSDTEAGSVYNNLADSLAKKAAENHRNKNYDEWEKGPQQQSQPQTTY